MPSVANVDPSCQVPDDLTVPDDILEHFLPGGGLSLLAGAPCIGKTALLAGMLRDLQAGRPVFGHTPRIVQWGYINTDRGWKKGAGLWLQRAGVRLASYSLSDDRSFKASMLRRKWERVRLLRSFIDRLSLPPDSGIVVDPISLFLGGNLLDYDSCMCACLEIREYLLEKQYTLLGLAHSGKLKVNKTERYVRPTDKVMGSTSITGFADAILHLAGPEETGRPYYQLAWQPHGAPAQVYNLERDAQGLFVPYSGVDDTNKRSVLALFPDPPASVTTAGLMEHAEAIPLTKRTVHRVLETLLDQQLIEKVKHGEYRRSTIQ